MSYDRNSPLLGQGQATATQIDRFMANRGQRLAADDAPDGMYAPPPAGLGQTIIDECRRYADHLANHDAVAGQIADETAGWQSHDARDLANPGGIGHENDYPERTLDFTQGGTVPYAEAVRAGVRTHVAHYLNYAVGRGPWSADDARTDAIDANGWLGVCHVLADLEQRWAWSKPADYNAAPIAERYGSQIATLANQLLGTTGGTPVGTIPTPPLDTSHPSPNRDGFSAARRVEAIVWHISQGTLASNLSWLTNPASGASANYEIARDGTIYELVPPEHSAWANGPMQQPDVSNPIIAGWHAAGVNANPRTISIEHEGYSSDNNGGSLTPAQIDSHIWLTAWLCEAFNLPPDRTHIIGHYQIDRVDRPYCPGFSDQEWRDWVAAVASYGQSPAPASAPPADDGLYLTGPDGQPWPYAYRRGFKGYVQQLGGARYPQDVHAGILSVFGYPKGEETAPQSDGKVYQEAERTILQYSPNTAPPWDIVMLPREAQMP